MSLVTCAAFWALLDLAFLRSWMYLKLGVKSPLEQITASPTVDVRAELASDQLSSARDCEREREREEREREREG